MSAFGDNSTATTGRLSLYPERPNPSGPNEWLFVTPRESKGWILDAICREIGSRQSGSWEVVYNPSRLPEAEKYFFSHYWNYLYHIKKNPHIKKRRVLVWYTHPREIPYSIEEQVEAYNQATCVVFSCREYQDLWIGRGVAETRTAVVLGGADPWMFKGHQRGAGHVGLSSSFYERKSPDTVLDVVRSMSERKFTLIGRSWNKYSRFEELIALPNFEYIETDYKNYPRYYADFDVFLSLAMLEGGPIPLLEAMTENAVPVASRTGFAPDLIRDGENGYLFPVGAEAGRIIPLIEAAFENRNDIRASVAACTWDDYARQMHELAAKEPAVPAITPLPGVLDGSPASTAAEPEPSLHRVAEPDPLQQQFDYWATRLGVVSARPGPVVVIITEIGDMADLLQRPAIDQILDLAIEPFLIVTAPVPVLEMLNEALRRIGADGLVELTSESIDAVVASLPAGSRVAKAVEGLPLADGELQQVSDWLATANPSELFFEQTGATGERRRAVSMTIRSGSDDPSTGMADGKTGLTTDGAILRLSVAPGLGLIVMGMGRLEGTALVRVSPGQAARELALMLPSRLVVREPVEVQVLAVPRSSEDGGQSAVIALSPADISPRMLNVYRNGGGGGNPVVEAFAAAVNRPISSAEDETGPRPGIPVVWGVLRGSDRVVELAQRNRQFFYYIDHSYFERGHNRHYRISRNAHEASVVRACPTDRIEKLGIRPRPWRRSGGTILVCPPTRFFMDAHGCPNWLEDTISALTRATDRPIEIRGKPQSGAPNEPLDSALGRAWAVVTHSSNVAVEAVVAGVPAFVAPTSAALHVAETDLDRIELPRRPDREAWLAHLAYSQFSFAEVKDGSAWRMLIENESRQIIERTD